MQLGPTAWDFLGGRRTLKVPIKVSRSPTAGAKAISKRKPAAPTSTLFTSPISPSSRRNNGKGRATVIHEVESDYGTDGFLDDSEDAFEPAKEVASRRTRQAAQLGPPITADDRMAEINDVHQSVVEEFVMAAKKVEERLITKHGHTRRIFTEHDFREMAINWTVSLADMHDIPGIDRDKVVRYGKHFMPLVQQYYHNYEQMMGQALDRDMDPNHQVIDLCEDDDDEDEDDEEDEDGSEDDDENQTSGQSKFFASSAVERFNQEVASAQMLPQTRHERPEPQKRAGRGGGFKQRGRGGGRGGKRNFSGRSTGSSTGASRKASGAFGVAKKTAARKTSYTRKPAASASFSKTPSYLDKFKHNGGGGGGSGGGGIMSMPI